MDIATDDRTRLHIRRHYAHSVAVLYAAWTDADQMKRWMGPADGFGDAEITMDVRVGGRYRFVMHAPDGEIHRVGGVFREVVANRRLAFTWAWESTPDRASLVTVEFATVGEGSELRLTHERFADEDARDHHLAGWNGCLDRLGRFLVR